MMSSDEIVFQVVVVMPDGSETPIPMTRKLMNIGSREGQDIVLLDDHIQPNQGRILVRAGNTESVLYIDLVNVGSAPQQWQVGQVLHIGSYRLRLEHYAPELQAVSDYQAPVKASNGNGNGHSKLPQDFLRQVIRGDLPPRPSSRISPAAEAQKATLVDVPIEPADLTTQRITPITPEEAPVAAVPDDIEPIAPSEVTPARDLHFFADDDNWQTQPYVPPLHQLDEEFDPNTQPKSWAYQANLGAQVTLNPVKAVPGERVRVPLSVRNANEFPIEVRVMLTGLPMGWEVLSAPLLPLKANEITLTDLVIQTQPGQTEAVIDAMVHLKDMTMQGVSTQAPLQFALRRDADLVGWLEPDQTVDGEPAYLHLQNHTRSAVTVFLNGGSDSDNLRLRLAETRLDVPPGQAVRVAVQFGVSQRPLLRAGQRNFWISAQQGTRAPLDYTSTVKIQPRLRVIPLLAVLLIGIISAVVLYALLTSSFN